METSSGGRRAGFPLLFFSLLVLLCRQRAKMCSGVSALSPADRNPAIVRVYVCGEGDTTLRWHLHGLTLPPPGPFHVISDPPNHTLLPQTPLHFTLEVHFLFYKHKWPRTMVPSVGKGHGKTFTGVGKVLYLVPCGSSTGVHRFKILTN